MKVLRFLGAVFCAIASIGMLFCLVQTLTGHSTVNPKIIESSIDKLFWILAIAGCSGLYATASISLIKGVSPEKSKAIMAFGVITCFAFMAGLYYTVIFGSPW